MICPCVCGIGGRGISKVWGDDIAFPRVRKTFEAKRVPRRAASDCTSGHRRRLAFPLPLHRPLDARASRRRTGVLAWTQVHEVLAGQPVERDGPKRERGGDDAHALDGQPGEGAFLVFRRDRTAIGLEGIPYRKLPRPRAVIGSCKRCYAVRGERRGEGKAVGEGRGGGVLMSRTALVV